jgi:AraC-like DNA-binding protein
MSVSFLEHNGWQEGQIITHLPNISHPPLVKETKQTCSFWFGDLESVELTLPGIHIIYGDWKMREKAPIEINEDEEFIEMHFTLFGKREILDLQSGHKYDFSQNQQNLYYLPGFTGFGGYQAAEYKFVEIRFSKNYFLQLVEHSSPVLMDLANAVTGTKIKAVGQRNRPISLAMHQCLNDIMHCPFKGGLKLMFLHSKCIELLTLQAQSHEASATVEPFSCKSTYDQECIHYAREYLLQHADNPPSLSELARIAGLNEFKLKKGFKEIYQHTVFGYLNDYRLDKAKQLLLHKTQPIKEISDNLGYSSVQHFTKAFKKKFGIPPGLLKSS